GENYNHNVFATNALLFGEISRLIVTGQRPPHKRTPELAPVQIEKDRVFWRYDPSRDIILRAREAK
ncbi:MAG: hypothetical protein AAFR90_15085, partial [Pseudomonadota bacterium]